MTITKRAFTTSISSTNSLRVAGHLDYLTDENGNVLTDEDGEGLLASLGAIGVIEQNVTNRVSGGASADHSKRVPGRGSHGFISGILGGKTWGNTWGFVGVQPSSSWGLTWSASTGVSAAVDAKPEPFNTGRVSRAPVSDNTARMSAAPAPSVTKRVSG